jgi:trans-2-enoyl-CoA reductase
MKSVRFSRFGRASEVASLVEEEEPGAPPAGHVLFELEATPINPSDLLHFSGRYATPASLPSYAGGGVLGRVLVCGPGVMSPVAGDRVILINTERSGWRERFVWPSAGLIRVPADLDPVALSLLAANPPTAYRMLRDFMSLAPGDWVIQNAANSSVGMSLVQIASAWGIRTLNVVRRPDVAQDLIRIGGTVVVEDSDDLAARVREITGTARIPLGIDAIAGMASARLAQCVDDGGSVVNYGLLSGEACRIEPADVLFRGISLRGFWYSGWLSRHPAAEVTSMFADLLALHADGDLHVPVEATYPVDRLCEALAHAERAGRSGKIVLRW